MADSLQININTTEALESVDKLIKRMDRLNKVSSSFSTSLTNNIIKPIDEATTSLNKVGDAAKTVVGVFESLAGSINAAFASLKSSEVGGTSAINKLKELVKDFVRVGKLDKGGDFSKLSTSFDTIVKALNQLKNIIVSLQKQVPTLEANAHKVFTHLSSLIASFATFGGATGGLNVDVSEMVNTFKAFESVVRSLQSFSRTLSSLTKSGSSGGSGMANLVDNIQVLFNHMTKLAQSPSFTYFERMANAMSKVSSASKNLVTATTKVQSSFNKLNSTCKQTKSWFDRLHPAVRQMFTAFAGYNVIYAFVRSVQAAVREMVDLEDKMARVNTIARGTESQLASWTQGVMDLSSTYGLAKNDLTQALYDINSATITGSRAFMVLEASSKAAVAGFTDVSKTANLLSRIINAYGYSASDAGKLSDILFKTVERGINPMEELSQYMGRVLTVAANAGVAFEEVSAAIATMTSRGLQTNIAVTALNSAVLKLSQGSDRLNAVFHQYGYISSAAALQTGGLAEAVRILQQATGGSTEALTKLGFNYRDIRAMTVLASDAFSEFKKNLEEMKNAEGATDAALKERAETLQMKWNRLKETIGNAFIALQQWAGASEFFKGLVDALSKFVNFMVRVAIASEDSLTSLESFTRTVIKLIVLFKMIKVNIAIFTTLKTKIGLLSNTWHFWNTKIKAQGGLFKTLRNTITVLKNAHAEYARTGEHSMMRIRRAAKLQGISIKQLRIGVILLRNAWKLVAGVAIAALEIAAFEALEHAMTKDIEKAETATASLDNATEAANNLRQALARVRTAPAGDVESIKAMKEQLDALKAEIKSAESTIAAAKNSGQKVDESTIKNLNAMRQEYEFYKSALDSVTDAQQRYLQSHKEWLNIKGILDKVSKSHAATLVKETSALSRYLAALQRRRELETLLSERGIIADSRSISSGMLYSEVERLTALGKVDATTRASLIELANVFDTIASNMKSASSELQTLSKSLHSVMGLVTPFHEASRALQRYQSLQKKIVIRRETKDLFSRSLWGQTNVLTSRALAKSMSEYKENEVPKYMTQMSRIQARFIIPFQEHYAKTKAAHEEYAKAVEKLEHLQKLEANFVKQATSTSVFYSASKNYTEHPWRSREETVEMDLQLWYPGKYDSLFGKTDYERAVERIGQHRKHIADTRKALSKLDDGPDHDYKSFSSFFTPEKLKEFSSEMQAILKNTLELMPSDVLEAGSTALEDSFKTAFTQAIKNGVDKDELAVYLFGKASDIMSQAQQLIRQGKTTEARNLLEDLAFSTTSGRAGSHVVDTWMKELQTPLITFEAAYKELIAKVKRGASLSEVLLDFEGSAEERETFIQYVKEFTEDMEKMNKYLNDTRLLEQKFVDPVKKLEAQRKELERLRNLSISIGGKTKTGQQWLDLAKKVGSGTGAGLEGPKLIDAMLTEAGIALEEEHRIKFKVTLEGMAALMNEVKTQTEQASKEALIRVPVQIRAMDAIRSSSSAGSDLIRKHVQAPTVRVDKDILTQVQSINKTTKTMLDQGLNSKAPTIVVV